jgi:hypothetical protein
MGIKILRLRHLTTPPDAGCRWCGMAETGHSKQRSPWQHFYDPPTPAQRTARMAARPNWTMPGVASDARTRL